MPVQIERQIVPFIKRQFPAFYQEYGPDFIRFVEEYYRWMEEGGLTSTVKTTQTSNSTANVFTVETSTTSTNTANVPYAYSGNGVFEPVIVTPTVPHLLISNSVVVNGQTTNTQTEVTTSGNTTTTITLTTTDISGKVLSDARQLLAYNDIDSTVDDFITYFSNQFLNGIQFDTESSKEALIKSSVSLYSSKGSSQAINLIFQSVFNKTVDVYYPGDDIVRASDGKWVKPIYLEVSRGFRNVLLVGKEVTGSKSGARAFVENIITRNINGKLIDLLYLSNVRGTFLTGDIITDNGVILNAPKVLGSLTSIQIISGGSAFTVGEEVSIVSSAGVEGKARVTEVVTETGKVSFRILDGGWGYSNTANVSVSEKVLLVSNVTSESVDYTYFADKETVSQSLYVFNLDNVTGDFIVGSTIQNIDGANSLAVYVNQTSGQNTAVVTINPTSSSNVFSNNIFRDITQQWVVVGRSNTFTSGGRAYQNDGGSNTSTGIITSVSNSVVLTISNATPISSNGFHVGQFIIQNTTNANGYIELLPSESNMGFSNVESIVLRDVQGTFNNTNTITAFSEPGNSTPITTASPNNSTNTYTVKLKEVSGDLWYAGYDLIDDTSESSNEILVVGDVGGRLYSNLNVSASGLVMGANDTAIGLIDVENTFYSVNNNVLIGGTSNVHGTVTFVSSGFGAQFKVGTILDYETVRVNPEGITTNNVNNVEFSSISLNGVGSGFTYLSNVYVSNSGVGYNNTNIVVFSGGNSGSGSYTAGNAAIVTDIIGSIVRIILSSNTGNLLIDTPNTSIVNSTGGSTGVGSGTVLIPSFPYGYVKNPYLDLTSPLLDALTFEEKTIGTIATLSAINPGENYNTDPFIRIDEPIVSVYGKRDILLELANVEGAFIAGETVEQSSNEIFLQVVSDTFTDNTNFAYEVSELVYTTDGIQETGNGNIITSVLDSTSNTYTTTIRNRDGEFQETIEVVFLTVNTNVGFVANDFVQQYTVGGNAAYGIVVNSNTSTLVIKDVEGTFVVNSTPVISTNNSGSALISVIDAGKVFQLIGRTSNGHSDITSLENVSSDIVAKGEVYTANDTVLTIRRKSLFTQFVQGDEVNLLGKISGATARVIGFAEDPTSNVAGNNAVVTATVVAANGSISNIEVISSGFGFNNNDLIEISSSQDTIATARAYVTQQGVGEGYYADQNGFVSDNKYIHDGEYYQEYSYEVRSDLPLDKYADMLRLVLHVAGTKQFGKIDISSTANLNIDVAESTIETS